MYSWNKNVASILTYLNTLRYLIEAQDTSFYVYKNILYMRLHFSMDFLLPKFLSSKIYFVLILNFQVILFRSFALWREPHKEDNLGKQTLSL